jgi:hypothetical protein
MRSIKQYGTKVTNWQLLIGNLGPHLAEMAQVQPLAAQLETLVTEVQGIDKEQEISRGKLRELTHRRQQFERQGESLRSRIGAMLRGQFGFTSEQLIQFGFAPRPVVIRRKKAESPPATAPTPAPNPAPTTS